MVHRSGGQWTFRLTCPGAQRVYLVGDFNDWSTTALEMDQIAPAVWEASLQIPPGTYRFRYFVADGRWITDYAAFGVARNQTGGWDSILYVPQADA